MGRSSFRQRLCVVLVAGVTALCTGPAARAAELTAAERQQLEAAKRSLSQLNTNLKLAGDAAGPGEATPPPPKARLATARLDSARASAAQVEARLKTLPAEHADVKALRAEYDAATKAVAALGGRLSGEAGKPAGGAAGGPPPKPADRPAAPAPPAAAGGSPARLGYREQTALDIAKSNIAEVAGYAERAEKRIAELKAAPDPAAVPLQSVQQAAGDVKEARRKAGFAEAQLKNLPAAHPAVRAAADALKAALARADAAEQAVGPLAKQLTMQVDAGSYPELEADKARLQELTNTIRSLGGLQNNPTAAAELVSQLPAIKAEAARLEQKYAALLKQNATTSEDLRSHGKQLAYVTKRFEDELAQERKVLPQQIDEDLANAARIAEEAVKESKPAFFGGGVADHLRFAEDRLVLYAALDPAGGKVAADKLAKAREMVKQRQQSLAGVIVEANPLPADNYAGPDKADLAKRATDALKKQRPNAEVLAVRFPSEKWARETKWRNQNGEWYRIDRSKVQAQVIVKRDDTTAEVHPINLWTDHMSGDAVTATPLFDEKEQLGPNNLLLLSKVK